MNKHIDFSNVYVYAHVLKYNRACSQVLKAKHLNGSAFYTGFGSIEVSKSSKFGIGSER